VGPDHGIRAVSAGTGGVSYSTVQYSSWLGGTQRATREPGAHGHDLQVYYPSFSGRVRGRSQSPTQPAVITITVAFFVTSGHAMAGRHNTSGIAHQGRAGGTRPGKSLKGFPQAAKAAAKSAHFPCKQKWLWSCSLQRPWLLVMTVWPLLQHHVMLCIAAAKPAPCAAWLQVQSVPVDLHQRSLWWSLPGPQPHRALHRACHRGQHMARGPGHPPGEEEQAHGTGTVCPEQVSTGSSTARPWQQLSGATTCISDYVLCCSRCGSTL